MTFIVSALKENGPGAELGFEAGPGQPATLADAFCAGVSPELDAENFSADADAINNDALICGGRRGDRTLRRHRAVLAAGAALMLVAGAGDATAADSQPEGAPPPAQAPAPIGVFGTNMPIQGQFVLSILPSFTRNQDSMIGVNSVSSRYIISHVYSAYTPAGDHLLRTAPASLSVETQAFNLAYGFTNNVTLNVSAVVLEKSLHVETFKGLTGSTPLGDSRGDTSGIGDISAATIVRVYRDRVNQVNFNFGLSLPTGSTTETTNLLTPAGKRPTARAFYLLQTGSGTVDAMPGVTYSGVLKAWSWGVSYRGRLPLDNNDQGYRWGDLNEINIWGGYSWTPGLETTLRLDGSEQSTIHGDDPLIRSYGQTANPLFYGGQQISLFGGAVISGRYVGLNTAQLGFEVGAPVYQQFNGPQLSRDWQANLALRFKF